MPNLWLVFLTGLLTGGLTCLAVQGGLLATLIAQREGRSDSSKLKTQTIVLFLASKLVSYTLLGFLLGFAGSLFQMTLGLRALFQGGVAIFMIGTALALLDIHPIFRYFILQPPKFLTKLVRSEAKSQQSFAPISLGVLTVFVPCGTTQAMMALALGIGNPFWAAAVMFTFVLGTIPLFFVLGFAASQFKNFFQRGFGKVVAVAIVLMGLFNFNGALALADSPLTAENLVRTYMCTVSFCNQSTGVVAGAVSDEVTISFESSGYRVDHQRIKTSADVKLNLVNRSGGGCIQAFTIPKLGISEIVPVGQSKQITIKTPNEPGRISFMCSMGMYQGYLDVI